MAIISKDQKRHLLLEHIAWYTGHWWHTHLTRKPSDETSDALAWKNPGADWFCDLEVGLTPVVALGHLWDHQSQQKNIGKSQSLSAYSWTDQSLKDNHIQVNLSRSSVQRPPPSESPRVLVKEEEGCTPDLLKQNLWSWGLEIFIFNMLYRLFLCTWNFGRLWSSFLGMDESQPGRTNHLLQAKLSDVTRKHFSLPLVNFLWKYNLMERKWPHGENGEWDSWETFTPSETPFIGPPTSMTIFLHNPSQRSL